MDDLDGKIAAGESLMRQAMDALFQYNGAKEHASPEKVERLRLEAELLFEAVHEYQRRVLGIPAHQLH
ncbi:hypothetical protein D3C77_403150 [compost metagenome]